MRREHADFIREKRKEALDAQALLAEAAKKRAREEEAKNGESRSTHSCGPNSATRRADSFALGPEIPGLILEEAIYGVLESKDDKVLDEVDIRWLDVTGTPSHPESVAAPETSAIVLC